MVIKKNQGLIKLVLIIIIGIIVLSYFGFNLRGIIEDEQTQDNFDYVWGGVVRVWNDYLRGPATFFWQNFFIDLIWESFVENFERIKAGEPSNLQENTPAVEF